MELMAPAPSAGSLVYRWEGPEEHWAHSVFKNGETKGQKGPGLLAWEAFWTLVPGTCSCKLFQPGIRGRLPFLLPLYLVLLPEAQVRTLDLPPPPNSNHLPRHLHLHCLFKIPTFHPLHGSHLTQSKSQSPPCGSQRHA